MAQQPINKVVFMAVVIVLKETLKKDQNYFVHKVTPKKPRKPINDTTGTTDDGKHLIIIDLCKAIFLVVEGNKISIRNRARQRENQNVYFFYDSL